MINQSGDRHDGKARKLAPVAGRTGRSTPQRSRGAENQDRVAAFLPPGALSSYHIDQIRRRAMRHGVTFDQVLLAEGHMDQTMFFSAFAQHLRLPFIPETLDIDAASLTPLGLRAEIVALASPAKIRFVTAPTGPALAILLREHARGGTAKHGLAISTPACLAQSLRHCGAALTATLAAKHLPNQQPNYSAFGLSAMAIIARLFVAFCAAVALWFGAPAVALASALSLLLIILAPTIALRLIASTRATSHHSRPVTPPRLFDRELPFYSIIIALRHEKAIIPQLVAAMKALDYPASKLDVKFVLEVGDNDTVDALRSAQLPPNFDILVCPDGYPRTKPRALNAALAFCKGEIVAVYDAEDIPNCDQIRRAAEAFAHGPHSIACYQARLVIDNVDDSWLTRIFALEYAALFDRVLPGLARLGLPIPLGGTSNHFRRAHLEKVLGWDAWNVTEDADLGLRFARLGFGIGHLPSDTLEEAPSRFPLWFRQRRRWLKGWMQTCFVHLRNPRALVRELGWLHASVVAIHTLGTIASALLAPWTAWWAITILAKGADLALGSPATFTGADLIGLCLAVAGTGAIVVPAVSAAHARGLKLSASTALLAPLYICLISLAAWAAIVDFFVSPTHWHKTEHGLARTSRTRQRREAAEDVTGGGKKDSSRA